MLRRNVIWVTVTVYVLSLNFGDIYWLMLELIDVNCPVIILYSVPADW
jgi:hypothetical protein